MEDNLITGKLFSKKHSKGFNEMENIGYFYCTHQRYCFSNIELDNNIEFLYDNKKKDKICIQ
jgi:hypothetical protein